MRRRQFIALLGSVATSSILIPPVTHAQQTGRVFRIGFLGASLNSKAILGEYRAFLARLKELGFNDGQNIQVEYRRIDDPRGPSVAGAELMQMQLDLIVAAGPEVALQSVIDASRSVPIVFQATNFDPIERGYVKSLAQPGGNITGLFLRQPELAAKQLELLTQAFPDRTRLGALWDSLSSDQFAAVERAAASMHLELRPLKLEKPPYDFAAAFNVMAQSGAQFVHVLSSPYFTEHGPQIADLALRHRLPTMFIFKPYVAEGGLMSYGVDQMSIYIRTAELVAKILNGAKAAELPLEQPTKFELVINLKTAKSLGITIPPSIMVRADEVIE
jgi:putative ABC transport system substrate-binding protein